MSKTSSNYDDLLFSILQNEGQITSFLDVLFSFLMRRTDFFRVMLHPKDKLGFQPGVPKKILLEAFKKYETIASRMNEKLIKQYQENTKKKQEELMKQKMLKETKNEVEVTSNEETVITTLLNNTQDATNESPIISAEANKTPSQFSGPPTTLQKTEESSSTQPKASTDPPQTSKETPKSCTAQPRTDTPSPPPCTNPDEDPEIERQQKIFQANPESYNGAIRKHYCWSQSLIDLDAYVKVPKEVTKGKQVSVVVTKTHAKVSYANPGGEVVVVVDDDLCWPIHADQVTWILEPSKHVHISMEKMKERWWNGLLKKEPKISVRKIDNSRPMEELDDESQSKVEEMITKERNKRMGITPDHDAQMNDILKQAWDAEGSPFKGQPFDPSTINFSQSPMF